MDTGRGISMPYPSSSFDTAVALFPRRTYSQHVDSGRRCELGMELVDVCSNVATYVYLFFASECEDCLEIIDILSTGLSNCEYSLVLCSPV